MTKCYACPNDLPAEPVIAALSISEKDKLPELTLASVNIVFDRVEVAFCSLACARPRLILGQPSPLPRPSNVRNLW